MAFGVLLFGEVEELDFVGPWEIASMWHRYADGPPCVTIAQRADPVACGLGMRVLPDCTFDDVPALDYLLVPGGFGTRREAANDTLVEFVREQAGRCRAVLSVCTGAFVLHAAGLLSGRRATTHWKALAALRELDDVTVVEDRYVRDGPIWTAAGVSAGIDMTLALVADVAGDDAAGQVQAMAEYYPDGRRYGNGDLADGIPRYVADQPA